MGYEVLYNFADDCWTGVYSGTREECELYLLDIVVPGGGKLSLSIQKHKYKIKAWNENMLFGEGLYGS